MSVAVAHQINKASDVVLAAAVSEAALRGTRLVVLHVVTSKDLDHVDARRVRGIQQDRVEAHASRARLPRARGGVGAQPRQLLPALPPSVVRNNAASSTPA